MYYIPLSSIVEKYRLNDLDQLINSFENDLAFAITSQQIKDEQTYLNILLHTAGNVIVKTREILCLVSSGYADGALALARTLYEHYIILSFFQLHENDSDFGDYIDDYYLDYEKTGIKYFRNISQKLDYSDLSEEIQIAYEQLEGKAHKPIKKEYWWAGFGSFADLCNSIIEAHKNKRDHKIHIRMFSLYKHACASLHPSCFSITWRLEAGNQYRGLNTAPSEKGHTMPLELSVLSLLVIIPLVLQKLEIDYNKYTTKLNELAALYIKYDNSEESII